MRRPVVFWQQVKEYNTSEGGIYVPGGGQQPWSPCYYAALSAAWWDGKHSLEKLLIRRLGFSGWCCCYFKVLTVPGASQMLLEPCYDLSPCQKELAWLCPLPCHHGGTSQRNIKLEA